MLALFLGSALAMDIEVERQRGVTTYLFVDGVAHGAVTRKDNAHLTLPEGSHELWFSVDEAGLWEVCRGTVTGSTLVTLGMLCTGLQNGTGPLLRTRDAAIAFRPSGTPAQIALDGVEPVPLPRGGVRVTVSLAVHSVRITTFEGDVLCSGTVDTRKGGTSEVALGVSGCTGLK